MGPNESDAFWLPRPQNAKPPVIPGAPKPAQAEEESDDHAVDPSEGTSAQSMAFDVKAAAAMVGWGASRSAPRQLHRRRCRKSELTDFLTPATGVEHMCVGNRPPKALD